MSKTPLNLREKLLINGPEALTDSELLAIFISSGSQGQNCLKLAESLLKNFGNLRELFNSTLESFKAVKGIGLVRYAQLQAAHEMSKRCDYIHLARHTEINSAIAASTFLKRQLRDKDNEIFAALFLDTQHRLLSYEELASGTIHSTTIHPRTLIKRALNFNAAAIILAHNHPSGNCMPSDADIKATKKISKALELIDVHLLDHIIIGDNKAYSISHGKNLV